MRPSLVPRLSVGGRGFLREPRSGDERLSLRSGGGGGGGGGELPLIAPP